MFSNISLSMTEREQRINGRPLWCTTSAFRRLAKWRCGAERACSKYVIVGITDMNYKEGFRNVKIVKIFGNCHNFDHKEHPFEAFMCHKLENLAHLDISREIRQGLMYICHY